ncbi:hypothetical protein SRHO_G00005210 [Serrasalmus rhombeus]
MEFHLDKFVLSPSVEGLVQCRKADLLMVAEFYNVPVSRSARKAEIRDVLLATLREDGRLPVSPDSRSPTRAQSALSVGVEGADDAKGERGVLSLAEAGGQTPRPSLGVDPVTTPPGPSSLAELDLNMAIRLKELDLAIKQQERETQLLRVRALERADLPLTGSRSHTLRSLMSTIPVNGVQQKRNRRSQGVWFRASPMNEKSLNRDKTAVESPLHLPETRGLPNCTAYLDDVVVHSSTWDEHMEMLKAVFERLDHASLTLNLAKCDFGKATVLYLGREVGQGRVRTPTDKVKAILDYPVPCTRRELRRFLEYRWSDDCQKAFEGLKSVLCSAPVLAAPNFSYPFKLDVDACDSRAGLVQCRKADLLMVAEFYNVPVSRSARKAEIRDVLLATLREDGRLPVSPDSRSPTRAQSALSVGVEGADDAKGERGVLSLAEAGGQTPRPSLGVDPVTTPPGPSSLAELDLNMAIRLKELDLAIKQQERETQLLRVRALERADLPLTGSRSHTLRSLMSTIPVNGVQQKRNRRSQGVWFRASPMNEKSLNRDKTAVESPLHLPETRGLPNCTAYLDDVVVHSSTWDEHMEMLKAVFERLDHASLTLNLAKCDFGKATVLYLGREVGQGRVRTPTDKVKAILDYPVPCTRRELRRFLEYRWSDDCQKAFEGLKSVLCSAPVLAAPNFSYPFKLDVDACDSRAGAVLLQEDSQGIDHPVELCPGLAAVGGAIPPEKFKGGVTQEARERGVREQCALACWPSSIVCVFVGTFGGTV